MDTIEMRVRLIEAACRTPAAATSAPDEVARRVLEVVKVWEAHVGPAGEPAAGCAVKAARERAVLGLPK